MNGFAKSLLPVLLWQVYVPLTSVALYFLHGAWDCTAGFIVINSPLLWPILKCRFLIQKATTGSGLFLHAACIRWNPSLAQLHSNKKKTYSRNKIHSYFCLIMHRININCLPKEKTINVCFHFRWRYNRLWLGAGLKRRASICSRTRAALQLNSGWPQMAGRYLCLESWRLGFEWRFSALIHFNMDTKRDDSQVLIKVSWG